MTNNTLHTVNRWNKQSFLGNVFDGVTGNSQMQIGKGLFNYNLSTPTVLTTPKVDWSNATQRNMALGQTKALTNSFGSGNPVNLQQSNQMLSNTISGSGGSDVGSGLFSKENNSPYIMAANTAAPTVGSLIGGGYHSGVGDTIGTVGSTVGSLVGTVNPALGLAINVGSQVIGGAVNGLFGEKVNEKKLAEANAGINDNFNYVGNASTFEDISGPVATASVDDVYKGGIFNSSAKRKNEALRQRMIDSRLWVDRSINNNVQNLKNDQLNFALGNYAAYGGAFDQTGDMGAIDYDFMTDYLTQKKRENDMKSKMNGVVSIPAFMPNSFAIGGDLQTNGGDFSDGLTIIGAGGSHETNPNEGIQIGKDNEETPNLVEEGETIFNDYVFSARIPIDNTTKELFHIGKKREMTYADLSKKLEKEIAERVNDPISKAGFEKQMQMLEEQQERQKQEMEAERAKAAFEALSPEEQTALMRQRAEQEAMQEAAALQQPTVQPTPEEIDMVQQQMQQMQQADGSEAALGQEPQMNAEGGKINEFEKGGPKKHPGKFKDAKGMWDKYTKKGLETYLSNLEQRIALAPDEETKNAIRQEAIDTFKTIQSGYAGIYPSEESDVYPYSDAVRNHQIAFNNNYGNTGFYTTDANGNVTNLIAQDIDIPNGGDVADIPTNWADGYWGPRTSIRNFGSTEYGDSDYYKELADRFAKLGLKYAPNEEWKYGDNTLYGLSLIDAQPQGTNPARWDYAAGDWAKPDGTPNTPEITITPTTVTTSQGTKDRRIRPVYRNEGLRYAGLFGPAVGLGMQMAGIGRPNLSGIDAAVASGNGVNEAKYKPLGNYLTYRPMDIWFEQNRMDANARATDRSIMNASNGNTGAAMAGLLANNYNNQIADGQLYRQALEYNDAQRQRVADFNRGTDQYNSDAYMRTSQFNANARNQARQHQAQMRLHAANERLNADQGWYNSIYGNVAGLFKGIGDLGRENYQHNRIADMAATGIFGSLNPDNFMSNGYLTWDDKKRSNGGKINRKKGGRK